MTRTCPPHLPQVRGGAQQPLCSSTQGDEHRNCRVLGQPPFIRGGGTQPSPRHAAARGARPRGMADPHGPHGCPPPQNQLAHFLPPHRAAAPSPAGGPAQAPGGGRARAPHSPWPPMPPSWIHVSGTTSAEVTAGWLGRLSPWRRSRFRGGEWVAAPS